MLITIRRPWLLRVFGWRYDGDGKSRTEWPSYVTASLRLWLHWLRNSVGTNRMREDALRGHIINLD